MSLRLTPVSIGGRDILASDEALARFSERHVRDALRAHGRLDAHRETKHRYDNVGTLIILSSPLAPHTLLTPAELRTLKGKTTTFNPTREKKTRGGTPRRSIR